MFGIPPSRFAVTYNGIEFDLLEPTRPRGRRASSNCPPDSFVLGTASTLKDWKRVDRLVHALAAVDRPELRLLSSATGRSVRHLEELVDRLGVRSRTLFTGLRRRSRTSSSEWMRSAFPRTAASRSATPPSRRWRWACRRSSSPTAAGRRSTSRRDDRLHRADDAELRETLTRLLDDPQLLPLGRRRRPPRGSAALHAGRGGAALSAAVRGRR